MDSSKSGTRFSVWVYLVWCARAILLLFKALVKIRMTTRVATRVVKADFLKAVREAVAQRLIKAVKRLLYVVNKTNDCFKMHLTSVRLWASTFHY